VRDDLEESATFFIGVLEYLLSYLWRFLNPTAMYVAGQMSKDYAFA
jgi:hypothetical protein